MEGEGEESIYFRQKKKKCKKHDGTEEHSFLKMTELENVLYGKYPLKKSPHLAQHLSTN